VRITAATVRPGAPGVPGAGSTSPSAPGSFASTDAVRFALAHGVPIARLRTKRRNALPTQSGSSAVAPWPAFGTSSSVARWKRAATRWPISSGVRTSSSPWITSTGTSG
jgi:hypothetical protein